MARIRNPARQAGRFTGQQYQSGYEFRNPPRFRIRLGPWDRVENLNRASITSATALATEDKQVLSYLNGGLLTPLGEVSPIDVYTDDVSFDGDGAGYVYDSVLFYQFDQDTGQLLLGRVDASGLYVVERLLNGSTSSVSTIADPYPSAEDHIPYTFGSTHYFIPQGSPELVWLTFTDSGNVLASITSPLASFSNATVYYATVIQNNVVLVLDYNGFLQVLWSVDGSATDFTGTGADIVVMGPSGARIFGCTEINDTLVVFTSAGVFQISPTGTLPAFRVSDPIDVNPDGTHMTNSASNLACSHNDRAYFMELHGRLATFDGVNTNRARRGPAFQAESASRMIYSSGLDAIVVYRLGTLLFYNPETLDYIGRIATNAAGRAYLADAASGGIEIVSNSDAGRTTLANISDEVGGSLITDLRTPFVHMGNDIVVEFVEIGYRGEGNLPDFTVTANVRSEDGDSEDDVVLTKINTFSTVQRYKVNRGLDSLSIRLHTPDVSEHTNVRWIDIVAQGHNPPEDAVVIG